MSRLSLYGASLAAALLPLLVTTANAATLTVGASGGGCNHTTVQAAVNAANASPGSDEIRIARTATWTAQQITVNTNEEIRLIGGYATCTSTTPDGTKTILSGAGGDARPVLTIRGNGFVYLRGLTLRDGDQAGGDQGGGINFVGGGILDIENTGIVGNTAGYGGGIYAVGTTITAELVLGADVTVNANTARFNGGGIFSGSIETSIRGPGTSLLFNEAVGQPSGGGYGGGLFVVSGEFKSYAYISSTGTGGIGAIFSNRARYGAGIAVQGAVDSRQIAEVQMYSTDPAMPIRVQANVATVQGGGLYLKPDGDTGGNAPANARIWNTYITENEAPDGAAAFLDSDSYDLGGVLTIGGSLRINDLDGSAPPVAVRCPTGTACGAISGNTASSASGAIVKWNNDGYFFARRLLIQDNSGARLFDVTGENGGSAYLYNSLITGNSVTQELLRQPDDESAFLRLSHITVADNSIGAAHVIFANAGLDIFNSIIWQPGKNTIAAGTDDLNVQYLLTNSTTNMPVGPASIAAPRFVDPARGDYRPRAGALAVDFAPPDDDLAPAASREAIDGRNHTVDVPFAGVSAPGRLADVGAYERPALQPLVLNSDFDSDLNLWSGLSDSFWDAGANASGPVGSGSVRIPYVIDPEGAGGPRVVGRSQCIHLPGPGRYVLNGFGKVTSLMFDSNSARLRWELRYNGGALGCEDGAYNLTNTHILATTNTWRRPASGAVIEVPEGVWTRNTSLTIKLDTIGAPVSPPTAWFDGITLELDAVDTIFENGFD